MQILPSTENYSVSCFTDIQVLKMDDGWLTTRNKSKVPMCISILVS